MVPGVTAAHRGALVGPAAGVSSTGGGVTGVSRLRGWRAYWWCGGALEERVPLVSSRTGTDGVMSDDLTGGSQATPAQARVLAGGGQTGEVRGAVRGEDTLGPAVRGEPEVAREAGADTAGPLLPLVTVGTAVVVTARLSQLGLSFYPCEIISC